MADEIQNNTPEPTPQVSPVEQKAMEQGWVPQEQWEGNPDDWRPAKEFVDRGELFKKIDELKRENKSIKTAFDEFGKHHQRVKQLEYERALATLKAQKKEALEDNNAAAVIHIDDQIDNLKETRQREAAVPQVQDVPAPDPVFVQWEARNPWYTEDIDMKAVADEAGRRVAASGVTDKHEIIAAVDRAVRRAFPHKFNNPKRNEPGAVEGSSKGGRSREADESANMTSVERRIMDTIIKSTGMSREQYLKEYKDTKVRGA